MEKINRNIWMFLALLLAVLGLIWMLFSENLLGMWDVSLEQAQLFNYITGTYLVLFSVYLLFLFKKQQKVINHLTLEKEKLDMLFNATPDFIVFKDHEGRWNHLNDVGVKIYELENVEYIGKKDSEIAFDVDFYKDALIYCEGSDEEAWKKGESTRSVEKLPRRDGSYIYFDTIKVPMFHSDGRRKGILVLGRDITDLKITEDALRKTEKLVVVGELAAGIAHEIRNPLTSMKGFLQLVKEDTICIDSCQDLLISEIERINTIVTELLMLAKPRVESHVSVLIQEILGDTINFMSTEANLQNVTLTLDETQDFLVSCSENQLKQVFINIIKNAIDSIFTIGEVKISVFEYSESEFVVRFEDNGCGIEEERLQKIGEPFFSVKEKGIGLGMTVSFKIIKDHGGKVELQSQLKKGTIVDVILPKYKPE